MALEFKKDDETCSNVYLIDERLCLKNSFPIINTNVVTLTSNLNNLQNNCNNFNQIYNNFSSNSARWIRAISNFQTLSAGWFSAETTVKTLSSYWYTDLHVIYNKIIDLDVYTSDTNVCHTAINSWLIDNFNFNIANNQIINVDLYLSKLESFTWDYYKSYYESCVPTTQNKPSTSSCTCPYPDVPCNWLRVNDVRIFKEHHCVNAAKSCEQGTGVIVGVGTAPNCPNNGKRDVILAYSNTELKDKSLTRVITLKYQKVNDTIIKI
jgi:hypothetical protein